MSHYHRYYGPGSNLKPAMDYLISKGATSPEKAISLTEIESEDFRELIRLNTQTSYFFAVTPEGKYWIRENKLKTQNILLKGILIFFVIFLLFVLISSILSIGFFSVFFSGFLEIFKGLQVNI